MFCFYFFVMFTLPFYTLIYSAEIHSVGPCIQLCAHTRAFVCVLIYLFIRLCNVMYSCLFSYLPIYPSSTSTHTQYIQINKQKPVCEFFSLIAKSRFLFLFRAISFSPLLDFSLANILLCSFFTFPDGGSPQPPSSPPPLHPTLPLSTPSSPSPPPPPFPRLLPIEVQSAMVYRRERSKGQGSGAGDYDVARSHRCYGFMKRPPRLFTKVGNVSWGLNYMVTEDWPFIGRFLFLYGLLTAHRYC